MDTGFVCISKGPSRCWDIIWSFICLFSQLITKMLHKENNHFDTLQTTLTYKYTVIPGQQGSDGQAPCVLRAKVFSDAKKKQFKRMLVTGLTRVKRQQMRNYGWDEKRPGRGSWSLAQPNLYSPKSISITGKKDKAESKSSTS